jgi:hypothetical protein
MGVDLRLLPVFTDSNDFICSFSVLELERRRELWPLINDLPQYELPAPLSCWTARIENGEHGYGKLTETAYGDPPKWVTALALVGLRDAEPVRDNYVNRAVWAYLAELPPETRIVLDWH